MERRCLVPEKQIYKKIKQSTMESWLGNTQIMTTLKQTQDTKTIHPKKRKEMRIPRNKLQTTWKIINHTTQEHARHQTQEECEKKIRNTPKQRKSRNNATGSQTVPPPQTSRDAERIGTEHRRPETVSRTNVRIPNRTGHPRRGKERRGEAPILHRLTTQIAVRNANRENRPKRPPECRQVHREEGPESKCRECLRGFRGPAELREHRQYVCADQSRNAPMPENANQENAHQEIESDRKRHRQEPEEENAKTNTHDISNVQQDAINSTGKAAEYAHIPGQPRKPRESRGNANGTLTYEMETEKWRCTKMRDGKQRTQQYVQKKKRNNGK